MSAVPDTSSSPPGTARPRIVASVLASAEGAGPYQMFDVDSLDTTGARLVGPVLLEIGEEVTLRLVCGTSQFDVKARVTSLERGERDVTSVVSFDDAAADEQVRAVVGG